MNDEPERTIYFEGAWWLFGAVVLLMLWLFFGGGVQWLTTLFW